MKFTDIFIKRPVLSLVVSIFIFILGLDSIFKLDVRQYPRVENTVITITTAYPGASAELIQGFVTEPLQTAISSADGIDYVTSKSSQNVSVIKASLKLNFNSTVAFGDILAKTNSVTNQLPQGSQLPVITKTTGSSIALLYLNYSSSKLSSSQIYDYLVRVVQPKIQSISGVSSAEILGGNPFALRVWLKPIRMAALNVTADDITKALQANNYLSAAGQLKGLYTLININAHTDLNNVNEFKQIVVRQKKDRFIYLKDVADIELGSESYSSTVSFNGQRGIFIGVNALPSANPLTVAKSIHKTLPDIEQGLPPTLTQKMVYDSTEFIRASIQDVILTLIEASFIVFIVIFLFLGSFRSVLIPIVTIPLSLVGVAFAMFLLGYSLNILTLLAMVLAIGLVVDDAIVVVENIYRHMENGKEIKNAPIVATREIAKPIISMTFTLAAVFIPIGLTTGLTGALFKEFALTLAASVIISGIIALTLTPMMCSKILRPNENKKPYTQWIDYRFNLLQKFYQKKLGTVLENRNVVLVFGAIILLSVYFLFTLTPKDLAPQEDQGFLFAVNQAPPYANVHYLEKYTHQMDNIFSKYPEQDAHFLINGADGENFGFAGMIFKLWGDRKRSAQKIQPLVQEDLNNIAGIDSFIFSLPDLPTGSSGMPVQFVIKTTDDYKNLFTLTEEIKKKADKSGLFIVTDSDLKFNTPELNITIDRAKANAVGLTMQEIGNTLGTLLGGNYVNRFSMAGRSYKVIPQLPDTSRFNPSDLKKSYLRTSSGDLVPLSNFIRFSSKAQPGALNQFQQLNSATISGVMRPGLSQGTCLDFLIKQAKEILPRSMTYDFSGDSRVFINESNSIIIIFIFSLVFIFLVLAAQFESFRDPLAIMLSVPMAICGALILMNIGFANINIYTEIGLVTLVGLITKHGILMVDFANKLRINNHLDIYQAIQEAAATRLRPILMTTAAMVFGVVPLIFASGAGAASRHDLGIVIASGLTIGTLFTLFVVPAMYTFITSKKINER